MTEELINEIFEAIDNENIILLKKLVSKNNVNSKIKNKGTPLYYHLEWGTGDLVEVAQYLMEIGADVNLKRKPKSYSLLHLAVSKFNDRLVKLLLKYGALVNEHQNGLSLSPLHLPTTPEITNLLLQAGADVKALDSDGHTPLQLSITDETEEYTKEMIIERSIILINAGSETNLFYSHGWSLLQHAISKPFDLVVAELLRKDMDLNYIQNEIGTALHLAVSFNNKKVIRMLLKKGANPNIANKVDYWTPLFNGVLTEKEDIVKLLLDYGAQKDIKDIYGKKPVDYAIKENIINLLN